MYFHFIVSTDSPKQFGDQELSESDSDNECHDSGSEDERCTSSDAESDSGHSRSDDDLDIANDLLYEEARITKLESVMALLGMKIAFKLPNIVLDFIIKLILLHCPKKSKCIKSLYCFKNIFEKLKTPLIKHYYCQTCEIIVEKDRQICGHATSINYFIEISIIEQLNSMFKRPDFFTNLLHRFNREKINDNNLEDIYDGSAYQELFADFLSNPNNISLMWNTDGVPLFKSSKFSIWPFYLAINELPYYLRLRPQNVIFAGLWFGPKKPITHLFINAFKEDLRRLYKGVKIKLATGTFITLRSIILSGTCDLPAKALFLSLKQYNGNFGCPTCKIKGIHEDHRHLYPNEGPIILRTTQGTIDTAKKLTEVGSSEEGVKGESPLSKVAHKYIENTSIDVMHCVFLNVIKRLFSVWFDEKNHNHRGSLRKDVNKINERLKTLKPIDSVSRTPRTIEDYHYWKASELKWFILAYSLVILFDLMEDDFFNHHILLVHAITILTSDSIKPDDLKEADRCLKQYVTDFESLYGLENMTLNVHMLLHLARTAEMFGPLWTTSCFPFENLNGILKNFVKSSKNPELQIYNSLQMFVHYWYFKDEYLEEGSDSYTFCNAALKRVKLKRLTQKIRQEISIVGKHKLCENEDLDNETKQALGNLIQDKKIYTFNRISLNQKLYETEERAKNNKRNNSCVKYGEDKIGIIQKFIMACGCEDGLHGNCKIYAIIEQYLAERAFKVKLTGSYVNSTFLLVKINNIDMLALDTNDIVSVCFTLKVDDFIFAVEPSYTRELE